MKWALLRLPRYGGARHASGYDNRSRHRQVGFSGSRHRRGRQSDYPSAVEASLRPGVFPEASALPNWYRSLWVVASLVARAQSARTQRAADAAGLGKALRQAAEERHGRRRGNLRGREAANDAT